MSKTKVCLVFWTRGFFFKVQLYYLLRKDVKEQLVQKSHNQVRIYQLYNHSYFSTISLEINNKEYQLMLLLKTIGSLIFWIYLGLQF